MASLVREWVTLAEIIQERLRTDTKTTQPEMRSVLEDCLTAGILFVTSGDMTLSEYTLIENSIVSDYSNWLVNLAPPWIEEWSKSKGFPAV